MPPLSTFYDTQPHVVRALTNALVRNALHHAVGLIGVKATELGRSLFERIACTQAEKDACDPCQVCTDCKLIAGNNHPDAFIWTKTLTLDDARALTQRLTLRPRHATRHLVWFAAPHLLSVSVQNALLKVVEEPPTQTFFLLTVEQSDGLLSTLRSRLLMLRLRPDVAALADLTCRIEETSDDAPWVEATLGIAARGHPTRKTQLLERHAVSFLRVLRACASQLMPRDEQILMSQKFAKEALELDDFLRLTEAFLRVGALPTSNLIAQKTAVPTSRASESALQFVWDARQELVLHPNRTFFIERLLHAVTPH